MDNRDILLELYGTRDINEIAEKFAKEVKKRGAKVEEVVMNYMPALWLGQSFGTVATRYSALRKALKGSRNPNAKKALAILNFPTKGFDILKKKSDEGAMERKNSLSFDKDGVDALIAKLHEMIEKKDYPAPSSRQKPEQIEAYWLAAYLALVTGRRFTEILKTMEIEKHGTKVTIRGLLKKDPAENDLENACLLDDYTFIKKALIRLRKILPSDIETMSVDEVGKKYSYRFNRYLKEKIFGGEDISFHDLRAMYAEACWQRYGEESGMSKEDFIGFVLGHKKFVTATDHYLKFKS